MPGNSLAEPGGGPSSKGGPSVFISRSPEETTGIGERLGRTLAPGSVVALRGGLGAGKTLLVKGIARSLGIAEELTSPTYSLLSEYEGTLPGKTALPVRLYHFDAYRLRGDGDFAALGADECLYGKGISVIEWSERVPASIPPAAITVEIEILEGGTRRVSVSAPGLPDPPEDGP